MAISELEGIPRALVPKGQKENNGLSMNFSLNASAWQNGKSSQQHMAILDPLSHILWSLSAPTHN